MRRNYKKFLRRNRFTIRRTDILSQIIRPEAADGKFRGLRPSVCIRCPVFFGKTCIDYLQTGGTGGHGGIGSKHPGGMAHGVHLSG